MVKGMARWTSVGTLYLSLLGAPVEWLKNTLAFHPNRTISSTPATYGLAYEEVWFGGPDGQTLHGWYIPGPGDSTDGPEPLFIWFHGNGGNISHRLSHMHLLYTQVGGSHFMFDYQGYGKSRRKPTLPGILADGRDAISVAQARGWTTGKRVVYFGESLGAAVAVALAVEHPPDRVILSAPFYSLRAMGQLVLPLLAFLVEHDLNSARTIQKMRAPLLIIHGTADGTVPFQQGQDLYTVAPYPKQFYKVPGAGHTDMHEVGGATYIQVVRDFVRGLNS